MRTQPKIGLKIQDHWQRTVVLTVSFCLAAGLLRAQEQNQDPVHNPAANQVQPSADEVITTDIGLDQMEMNQPVGIEPRPAAERPRKSARPEELQIKEDQIIAVNRSLKKIIEANEKLRKQAKELDAQLRELRGQRNIDLTRVNTISVERDAYKSQNEIMSGLTQRYVEDIEGLKRELAEKESQLAHRPAADSIAESEEEAVVEGDIEAGPQTPAAADQLPEPVELGKIEVRKEDAAQSATDQGRDILKMLDDVKQKSQKLMADEAKVHYNMGNMFFKRREYTKAKNEFETALKLSPQDPFTHFNLAFVSGEYLDDYKTAMAHYKEYLELNPAADDAPLVREKIIEAELFLRSLIPSRLEKQVADEKGRLNK